MRRSNHNARNQPKPHRRVLFGMFLPQLPPLFDLLRMCLFATVILWTVICLAIAVHFQGLLVASDLTRFVPFAIFVCSASLAIFLTMLAFSIFRKDRSPISTRIELGCLGLTGTFWLALGAFLATSESEAADVECFASDTDSRPFDMPGFSTDTYRAQYHVLEAFSLFNVILIWGFFILLLVLAVRVHLQGKKGVWYRPATSYPWFGRSSGRLPAPVTTRSRSRGRAQEKARGQSRHAHNNSNWRSTNAPVYDKWARNASPKPNRTPQLPPRARVQMRR